jgi:hypothetical protein
MIKYTTNRDIKSDENIYLFFYTFHVDIQYLMSFIYLTQLLLTIFVTYTCKDNKKYLFQFFLTIILIFKYWLNNGKKMRKCSYFNEKKNDFFKLRNFSSFSSIYVLDIKFVLLKIQTFQSHGLILHKILNYHMLLIRLQFSIIQLEILYFHSIKMLVLHQHPL